MKMRVNSIIKVTLIFIYVVHLFYRCCNITLTCKLLLVLIMHYTIFSFRHIAKNKLITYPTSNYIIRCSSIGYCGDSVYHHTKQSTSTSVYTSVNLNESFSLI